MRYGVRYTAAAKKDISRLNRVVRRRLQAKLEFFYASADPLLFAQRLTKPADAQYRWRVGDYRVLFDVSGKTVTILRVQHRGEVYRR